MDLVTELAEHAFVDGPYLEVLKHEYPSTSALFSAQEFSDLPVELVSEFSYEQMFRHGCNNGWREFRRQYPKAGGLTGLSHVGFRNRGKEAFLYVETGPGCLAGRGPLLFLRYVQGRWEIEGLRPLWVS